MNNRIQSLTACGVLILASVTATAADPVFPVDPKHNNADKARIERIGDNQHEGSLPDILVLADFEKGLQGWSSDGTGELSIVEGMEKGSKALKWTAHDDGLGKLIMQDVSRDHVDFSQYDLMLLKIRFTGKRVWNFNPVIQQYPAFYGYRPFFWSIDPLDKFGDWYVFVQDLSKWENASIDSFSRENQEFMFEIHQMAGSERTTVCIDEILLIKNPLGIERSYPGTWGSLPDGQQVTHFNIKMRNRSQKPLTVHLNHQSGGGYDTTTRFQIETPKEPLHVLPGESVDAQVRIVVPTEVIKSAPSFYGETAQISFEIAEMPGLLLFAQLVAGIRPANLTHPAIICNPDKMQEWRKLWQESRDDPKRERDLKRFVMEGEKALAYVPEYPLLAPKSESLRSTPPHMAGGELRKLDLPNLPFPVFQDQETGKAFATPIMQAVAEEWQPKHMRNAAAVRNLGLAYAVTGNAAYALKAVDILRAYIDIYPRMPVLASVTSSPVYSDCSGAARIGGTFMDERAWLIDLALGLDLIRASNALSDNDLSLLRDKVFRPSANQMMDHKVGPMNLQWMIDAAGLYAGLACDDEALVARALYDGHGILPLLELGYLEDGNWWENPSYQNVCNMISFPVLATCVHTGILPWREKYERMLLAPFLLYGPNGRSPTLGTGGPASLHPAISGCQAFATKLTDPRLAYVVYNNKTGVRWSGESFGGRYAPGPDHNSLWAYSWGGQPAIAEKDTVPPQPEETTVFPDYGGIALRVQGQNNYAYFHYGRELVHGHRNKLSVNAYADGHWFMRNVAGGYGDNFKNFLETIASANTVMVDGRNPDADTGELLWQYEGEGWSAAAGRENGAWKDVEHLRCALLLEDCLVIIDRLRASEKHTYDWLYHAQGTGLEFAADELRKTELSSFGDSPLYESLIPAGVPANQDRIRLVRSDKSELTIFPIGSGDIYATKPLNKYNGLLWRKLAKDTEFVTVLYPVAGDESLTQASLAHMAENTLNIKTPMQEWKVEIDFDRLHTREGIKIARIVTGEHD